MLNGWKAVQTELFMEMYGEKSIIAGHSWGDNVARAFLHWMENQEPGWVDKHVAVLVNIAGPTLGVPKSLTAILSGAHAVECLVFQLCFFFFRVF